MKDFMRRVIGLALLGALAAPAHAAVRAWVQPDRIAMGQGTTLNVETDKAFAEPPDFSVLAKDFELGPQSSSSNTSIVNGRAAVRSVYAIMLEPKEAGVFTIPALEAGGERTEPLTLTVVPAEPGSAEAGSPIFIETEIGTERPYVQQSVPLVVRLWFTLPLRNGDLRMRPPENASLQQAGEDKTYRRDRDGIPYSVFERRFLLTPEKSGPLDLPAPQFRGVSAQSDVDVIFNRGRTVSAIGQRRTLDVRPQPDGAPLPWLPVSDLRLTRGAVNDSPRAGEPLMLEVTLAADGATSAQLPEIVLPQIPGAQVFPEPSTKKDGISDGKLAASVTRRFAIVPTREGALELPELRVRYWNTTTDRADVALLPSLALDVSAGALPAATDPVAAALPAPVAPPGGVATPVAGPSRDVRTWQWIAAAFGVAFVLALAWGWRRGAPHASAPRVADAGPPAPLSTAALRRALATGDLRGIADALRASTVPPSVNLDAFRARLGSAVQRDATAALERALWAPNVAPAELEATRAKLRAAFDKGVLVASSAQKGAEGVLPALYPERRAG